MRKLFIIAIALLVSPILLKAIYVVNPSAPPYNVHQAITFHVTVEDGYYVTWYWGDGTSTTGNMDYMSASHTYASPGKYIVKALCSYHNEYLEITIEDNREITYSPEIVRINQQVTFTALNFNTPAAILWDFGDGTSASRQPNIVSHTYAREGSYQVKAYDNNGNMNYAPVTVSIIVNPMQRQITHYPSYPRVEQLTTFYAENFSSRQIDWNFGDGTTLRNSGSSVTHRFRERGSYNVSAVETNVSNAVPVYKTVSVLVDKRFIRLSKKELNPNESVKLEAANFYGESVLWNFGDGSSSVGPRVIYHSYKLPGIYRVTAIDEGGASSRILEASLTVLGISDSTSLQAVELQFDNGKYYRIVNLNEKGFRALLRIKARGTGTISGFWRVDGVMLGAFSETAYQGEVKEITTGNIAIPTNISGLHTLDVVFNKPLQQAVILSPLKYFVTSLKPSFAIVLPRDGTLFKEEQLPLFQWQRFNPASRYQIAFSSSPFNFYYNEGLEWRDCRLETSFQADKALQESLPRNQWIYCRVRALDSFGKAVGETELLEFKIIAAGAEISVSQVSDLDGRKLTLADDKVRSRNETLLLRGKIRYEAAIPHLILTVYYNNRLLDRLVYNNVVRNQELEFETSVTGIEKGGQLVLQIATSASPTQIIANKFLEIVREE